MYLEFFTNRSRIQAELPISLHHLSYCLNFTEILNENHLCFTQANHMTQVGKSCGTLGMAIEGGTDTGQKLPRIINIQVVLQLYRIEHDQHPGINVGQKLPRIINIQVVLQLHRIEHDQHPGSNVGQKLPRIINIQVVLQLHRIEHDQHPGSNVGQKLPRIINIQVVLQLHKIEHDQHPGSNVDQKLPRIIKMQEELLLFIELCTITIRVAMLARCGKPVSY